ncbi:alpha/beta hydrolase [Flavobacterium salilacus subsp. salilacus]|uniref:alpha/beta fold hydrolase n=1 Tax=Flavobacterium TaxID=237 RepID=UPI00107500C5|nr:MULTISPECIES: alpha/beta hydrolase [Flavobacterium]KAF2517555.1 alpha/beta hydrolase [Flavobacterium salilacus subsp. salilacus]MBE1615704.1 alpha/beta hydrolase [Flavobacterium sp. SaA2.13]
MAKKNKPLHQPTLVPKSIIVSGKILQTLSPTMAARYAMKLFVTPMKFKLPKKEEAMERDSKQEYITIASLHKKIRVYHLGESSKKVLLVHGWSGRGTQLWSIADALVKKGYSTISFDAPAHGKSTGKTSDMTEFITCIHELDKKYGPFEYAIGHSLGAMAVLNAIKQGLTVKKAVTIGSGDIIEDIMNDFTDKLGLNIATCKAMIKLFEKKFGTTINSYSAYIAAKEVNVPVLVIHDRDDEDVPFTAAHHIHEHLANAELIITEGLGHRKILGDVKVINEITKFL